MAQPLGMPASRLLVLHGMQEAGRCPPSGIPPAALTCSSPEVLPPNPASVSRGQLLTQGFVSTSHPYNILQIQIQPLHLEGFL